MGDLGDLFVTWYFDLVSSNIRICDPAADAYIDSVLMQSDASVIVSILTEWAANDPARKCRVLEIIDRKISQIHPRTGLKALSHVAPAWLIAAESNRYASGAYYENARARIIPRGPLSRADVGRESSFKDVFADRFAYVRLANGSYRNESLRSYVIRHRALPDHALYSISPRSPEGNERILYLPLLHGVAEWNLEVTTDTFPSERSLLTVKPRVESEPIRRLTRAVSSLGKSDIAILPEFVMPAVEAANLVDALHLLGDSAPAILVAGSGLTSESDNEGRPWNEARVFNEFGRQLIVQRKLAPSEIDATRLHELGVSCCTSRAIENTGLGDCVQITDIPSLGRVLVLICHDIKIKPLVAELLNDYEPDWVFVPIFDKPISEGRWIHQALYEQSSFSNTRLISCATDVWIERDNGTEKDRHCGLAQGPRVVDDSTGLERATAFVPLKYLTESVWFGEVTWNLSALWTSSGVSLIVARE